MRPLRGPFVPTFSGPNQISFPRKAETIVDDNKLKYESKDTDYAGRYSGSPVAASVPAAKDMFASRPSARMSAQLKPWRESRDGADKFQMQYRICPYINTFVRVHIFTFLTLCNKMMLFADKKKAKRHQIPPFSLHNVSMLLF